MENVFPFRVILERNPGVLRRDHASSSGGTDGSRFGGIGPKHAWAKVTRAMATTGLLGPFRLAYDEINKAIPRVAPGVFMLGHKGPDGRFYVGYVGRADSDIRDRLLQLIGSGNLFKYRCSSTTEAAFHAECELFHDFQPPANRMHPDRPPGTNWECPRCRFFRLQARA